MERKGDWGCCVVFAYAWCVRNPLLGILRLPELDLRGLECLCTVQVRFPLSRQAQLGDEVITLFFYCDVLDHLYTVVYTLSKEVCVCTHTMHHTVPKGDDEIFRKFGCVSTFFKCSKLLTKDT
jgi:hypothetical protein